MSERVSFIKTRLVYRLDVVLAQFQLKPSQHHERHVEEVTWPDSQKEGEGRDSQAGGGEYV